MSNTDPLLKLVVSESQVVNKLELADLLAPYIAINKESKGIDFSNSFHELSNVDKILILFCATKARSIVLGVEEKVTPMEVIKMEIMPMGSVKGTLKTLLDSKEIKAEKGKYFLPNYKIVQVVARFKKNKPQ